MKSLAKNSIYNVMYKCLNVVFPLITSAYVSRILFAEGIGKVSSAQNIVTYFTILAALGIPTYGIKMIAANGDTREKQSRIFSELFFINAVSTIICSILYYFMVFTVPFFYERRLLFSVCGLSIVFNIINIDWLYQGKEEYRYIMIRSIIIKVISLLAILFFVKTSDDYVIYALILTLANALNYIFNIVHSKKYVDLIYHNLHFVKHLTPVFTLLAASIAIEIYTLADTTMLTFMKGDKIVGYYTTAMKGVQVVKTLATSVCAVFLPRLSYYYSRNQKELFNKLIEKGFKILAYITIPAFIGIELVAQDAISILYGQNFMESVSTMRILSISIVTVAFSNFIGYQILITIGKEKIMFISTVVGAVVNVILNYFMIPSLEHDGAAIASAITEFSVTIVQCIAIIGVVKVTINKQFVGSLTISCLFMLISVNIIQNIVGITEIRLILSIVLGICTYVIASIIGKNELPSELVDIIKNRIKFT